MPSATIFEAKTNLSKLIQRASRLVRFLLARSKARTFRSPPVASASPSSVSSRLNLSAPTAASDYSRGWALLALSSSIHCPKTSFAFGTAKVNESPARYPHSFVGGISQGPAFAPSASPAPRTAERSLCLSSFGLGDCNKIPLRQTPRSSGPCR